MPNGHYCFRCRKNFPNADGILIEDAEGHPQILCNGCYAIEMIKVVQKDIDALRLNVGLISLDTRLGLSISKLMLAEVVNA